MQDETYDVVVVGYGFAGAIAVLNAAQCCARTLLFEKSAVPGEISIGSYGAVRSARDAEQAFQYLKATSDGRTPDNVLRALAKGMTEIEAYVRELGQINGAAIATCADSSAHSSSVFDHILTLSSKSRSMPNPEPSHTFRSTRYGTLPTSFTAPNRVLIWLVTSFTGFFFKTGTPTSIAGSISKVCSVESATTPLNEIMSSVFNASICRL